MATISGYNSYSMGVLFSGLNTTSSKNSLFSSSMSGSDILGIITVTGNNQIGQLF